MKSTAAVNKTIDDQFGSVEAAIGGKCGKLDAHEQHETAQTSRAAKVQGNDTTVSNFNVYDGDQIPVHEELDSMSIE